MTALGTPGSWEKLLTEHTPWEERGGVWFKREDLFAPLGPGGPNGSKMRQLIHLFKRHRGNATHVMTAASVLSPQHSMTAIVAAHYGLPSLHFVGGTTPEKAARHPNVRIARGFGATFQAIDVGYNPALQSHLEKRRRPDTFVVPYGITTREGCDRDDLTAFHQVGGLQAQNLPEQVETLVVPAGSCNSLTSVIYGLVKLGHKNLKTLVSVGIGPDKVRWTQERLEALGVRPPLPFKWNHKVSLHDSGYAAYGDRMPASYAGIDFHPTYEGKIVRWMQERGALEGPGLGFWIVAGEADEAALAKLYPVPQEDPLDQGDSLKDWGKQTCEVCPDRNACLAANTCGHHGADL